MIKFRNKLELQLVILMLTIDFLLILYTNQITLRDFPNSGDEYAYLLSATIFSEGKLSVPSPEPKEFFNFNHVVNDGKYYGKYPPGWPLILSLGVLLNVPWIVNPFLAILTLILIYLIARENFSKETALIALFLTLFNPFFIFNSASYFSHASAMFFIALFVYFYFRYLDNPVESLNYILIGIAGGFAFLVRPYTALAALLPFGLYFLYRTIRPKKFKKSVIGILLITVIFGLFILAYLGYNYAQTGDPFLQPMFMYHNGKNILPIIKIDSSHLMNLANYHIFGVIKELHKLLPFYLVIVAIHLFSDVGRKKMLLMLLFASLLIGYFLIGYEPGNQYGPRYIYEAAFALFILAAFSLDKLIKKRAILLGILTIILFLNFSHFYDVTNYYSDQVKGRMQVYDLVQEKNISNAVVFLKSGSGSMGPGDLTRNGIHFNASVLYVLDCSEQNNQVLMQAFHNGQAFHNRKFYFFNNGHIWS